jgi:steroid delta-isomerase-like uncharacterized protein
MTLERSMMRASCCLLLLLLAACGREDPKLAAKPAAAPVIPAAATAAPQAAPAVAKRADAGNERRMLEAWLSAWNSHDAQHLGSLMTDDVVYFDAGFAGLQRGRDAAMERGVWVFLRGVPDLHWELRGEPIVGRDSVAWEWTLTGTHTGTWGSVRATQQRLQLKGVSLMRLRDGRVAEVASYYDSLTLNRQLGL